MLSSVFLKYARRRSRAGWTAAFLLILAWGGAPATLHATTVTVTVTGTVYAGALDQSNTAQAVFGPPGSLAGKRYTLVFTFDDTKGSPSYLADSNGHGTVQQSYDASNAGSSPGTAVLTIGGAAVSFGDSSVAPGATTAVSRGDRYIDGPDQAQIDFSVQDSSVAGSSSPVTGGTDIQFSAYRVPTNDGDWRTSVSTSVSTPNYLGYFSYTRYTAIPGRPGASNFISASGSLQLETVTVTGLAASPYSRRICFLGQDVTRTQDSVEVVPGQAITLTAGISNAPCQLAIALGQTQSWQVCSPGAECDATIIAYTPETQKTYGTAAITPFCAGESVAGKCDSPAAAQPTSGPFYWTSPGIYQVNYNYRLAGYTGSARATFNVVGPTVSPPDESFGTVVRRIAGNADPIMRLLGSGPEDFCGLHWPSGDTPGAELCARVVDPPGYPGTLFWVQLLSDTVTQTTSVGTTSSTETGLDNCYPYGAGTPDSTGKYFQDSPATEFEPPFVPDDQYVRQFSAQTYLMWRANPTTKVPQAIAVPLGVVSWGFEGQASFDSSGGLTIHPTFPSVGTWKAASGYPQWTSVYRNSEPYTGPGCP